MKSLPFPAVTFCNLNKFSGTRLNNSKCVHPEHPDCVLVKLNLYSETAQGTEKMWSLKTVGRSTQVNYNKDALLGCVKLQPRNTGGL